MTERVVEFDLGVDWNPNDEDCYLVQDDWGMTVLAIDSNWARGYDHRPVLITWVGSRLVTMGDPNDESIAGHRLYSKGLSDVYRSGTVDNSELISMLEVQNRVHSGHNPNRFASLIHYVLLLKGAVLEVVAENVTVSRFEGSLTEAATAAISPKP